MSVHLGNGSTKINFLLNKFKFIRSSPHNIFKRLSTPLPTYSYHSTYGSAKLSSSFFIIEVVEFFFADDIINFLKKARPVPKKS